MNVTARALSAADFFPRPCSRSKIFPLWLSYEFISKVVRSGIFFLTRLTQLALCLAVQIPQRVNDISAVAFARGGIRIFGTLGVLLQSR